MMEGNVELLLTNSMRSKHLSCSIVPKNFHREMENWMQQPPST